MCPGTRKLRTRSTSRTKNRRSRSDSRSPIRPRSQSDQDYDLARLDFRRDEPRGSRYSQTRDEPRESTYSQQRDEPRESTYSQQRDEPRESTYSQQRDEPRGSTYSQRRSAEPPYRQGSRPRDVREYPDVRETLGAYSRSSDTRGDTVFERTFRDIDSEEDMPRFDRVLTLENKRQRVTREEHQPRTQREPEPKKSVRQARKAQLYRPSEEPKVGQQISDAWEDRFLYLRPESSFKKGLDLFEEFKLAIDELEILLDDVSRGKFPVQDRNGNIRTEIEEHELGNLTDIDKAVMRRVVSQRVKLIRKFKVGMLDRDEAVSPDLKKGLLERLSKLHVQEEVLIGHQAKLRGFHQRRLPAATYQPSNQRDVDTAMQFISKQLVPSLPDQQHRAQNPQLAATTTQQTKPRQKRLKVIKVRPVVLDANGVASSIVNVPVPLTTPQNIQLLMECNSIDKHSFVVRINESYTNTTYVGAPVTLFFNLKLDGIEHQLRIFYMHDDAEVTVAAYSFEAVLNYEDQMDSELDVDYEYQPNESKGRFIRNATSVDRHLKRVQALELKKQMASQVASQVVSQMTQQSAPQMAALLGPQILPQMPTQAPPLAPEILPRMPPEMAREIRPEQTQREREQNEEKATKERHEKEREKEIRRTHEREDRHRHRSKSKQNERRDHKQEKEHHQDQAQATDGNRRYESRSEQNKMQERLRAEKGDRRERELRKAEDERRERERQDELRKEEENKIKVSMLAYLQWKRTVILLNQRFRQASVDHTETEENDRFQASEFNWIEFELFETIEEIVQETIGGLAVVILDLKAIESRGEQWSTVVERC